MTTKLTFARRTFLPDLPEAALLNDGDGLALADGGSGARLRLGGANKAKKNSLDLSVGIDKLILRMRRNIRLTPLRPSIKIYGD